jgi:hypothetical protein
MRLLLVALTARRLSYQDRNNAEHPLLIHTSELTRPGKYHIEVSRYFAYDKPDVLPHLGSPEAPDAPLYTAKSCL